MPSMLNFLRFAGTLPPYRIAFPLFFLLGPAVGISATLGSFARGRRGHALCVAAVALSVAFTWYVGGGDMRGRWPDGPWASIMSQAAFWTVALSAVGYGAGVALRAALEWQGDRREAVCLTFVALVALGATVRWSDLPVRQAEILGARAEAEGVSAARSAAILGEMAAEMAKAGTPVDKATLARFQGRMLAIGMEGQPAPADWLAARYATR